MRRFHDKRFSGDKCLQFGTLELVKRDLKHGINTPNRKYASVSVIVS